MHGDNTVAAERTCLHVQSAAIVAVKRNTLWGFRFAHAVYL